jgi:hypothetical protein
MDEKNIDEDLKLLAQRYVAYHFLTQSSVSMDEDELLKLLTPSISERVKKAVYYKALT